MWTAIPSIYIQDTGKELVHFREADQEFHFGHVEVEMPVKHATRDAKRASDRVG